MNDELKMEDVIDLIHDKVQEVENFRVYYTMRDMKIKYITETTVNTVRYCIVLHELGLPITAQLISTLEGRTTQNLRNKLHTLGDKQILTMIRGADSSINRWILNPLFSNKYYGNNKQ